MARSSRRSGNAVTIEDVARHAGVSAMTVSRSINGENSVRDTTREAVLASVKALNYVPNQAARSLASADHIRIGVIYSNPSAAYLSEFLVGVLDESAGKGAELLLVKCEGEQGEETATRRLIDSGVNGVVLPPPLSESALVRDTLKAAGIATVAVATGAFKADLSSVRVDDRKAAADMTLHLLGLGHRRIGFIKGHPNQTASAERLAGFEQAMDTVPDATALTAQGYFSFDSGLAAAEALLDARPRPTAIFASNDDMAAAVISVAHRRGLDVPGELSVAGFDDTQLAVTLWPPLTTVRQPVSAMAASAIDLLITEIRATRHAGRVDSIDTVMPHTLVKRQSCGPAPRG